MPGRKRGRKALRFFASGLEFFCRMPNTDFDRLAETLGFAKIESADGSVRVRAFARDEFLNGVGIAHGGFLFSLADYAAALAVNTGDVTAVSSNSAINYLRPCPRGAEVWASARVPFRNEKTAVCDVSLHSPDGSDVYAIFQSRFIVKK